MIGKGGASRRVESEGIAERIQRSNTKVWESMGKDANTVYLNSVGVAGASGLL